MRNRQRRIIDLTGLHYELLVGEVNRLIALGKAKGAVILYGIGPQWMILCDRTEYEEAMAK